MAAVRSNDGIPTVAPAGAPDVLQRINASPDAFGAAEGRAKEQGARELQGLGGSMQQAAQSGFQLADYFGQVQTDATLNTALDAGFKAVKNYKTLSSGQAIEAQAQTEKDVQEAFDNAKKSLKTQAQVDEFNKASGHYLRTLNDDIASHSAMAHRQFATDTNKAAGTLALHGIATYAEDDAQFTHFWADARRAAVQEVINQGNSSDPVQVKAAMAAADQAAFKTRIQTIGVKNPQRAYEMAQEHRARLGLDYDNVSSALDARATEQRGLGVVDQATGVVAGQLQAAPERAASAAVTQAIFDQESGDSGVNPGQITPDTWARWQHEGIVKPGQNYNNPADTRDVAKRATEMYYEQYKDPARVAVAWFSGPGNVAPEGSATPYLVDKTDHLGKSVSSYVSDVQSKVGTRGQILAVKAGMVNAVMDMTANDPKARQVAMTEITRRSQAAGVASMASQEAINAKREETMVQIGDALAAGKTVNVRAPEYSVLTEAMREHMEELQDKFLARRLQGSPTDLGPGYGSVHDRILSTDPAKRIVNQEQLIQEARAGNINEYGLNRAQNFLKDMNAPGEEGERMLVTNAFKSFRQQITLFDESSQRDLIPGSTEKWNRAVPILQNALSEGRAKGLTSAQLLSPDSKDYIGKSVQNLMPTKNEQVEATIAADHKKVEPFDIKTIKTGPDAMAARKRGDITREQAIGLVRAHPEWGIPLPKEQQRAPVVPTAVAVP